MAVALTLPIPDAVARMLRDLFGKPVTPKKGTPIPAAAKVCAAIYVDDTGTVVAAGLCDLPLATSMGAALALIPAGAAADAAKEGARTGQIPAEILDNLREVLNIVHSLFGGSHVRLRDLLMPSSPLPPEAAAIVARPRARLDLDLVVPGYSGGKLSLLVR